MNKIILANEVMENLVLMTWNYNVMVKIDERKKQIFNFHFTNKIRQMLKPIFPVISNLNLIYETYHDHKCDCEYCEDGDIIPRITIDFSTPSDEETQKQQKHKIDIISRDSKRKNFFIITYNEMGYYINESNIHFDVDYNQERKCDICTLNAESSFTWKDLTNEPIAQELKNHYERHKQINENITSNIGILDEIYLYGYTSEENPAVEEWQEINRRCEFCDDIIDFDEELDKLLLESKERKNVEDIYPQLKEIFDAKDGNVFDVRRKFKIFLGESNFALNYANTILILSAHRFDKDSILSILPLDIIRMIGKLVLV